jgi:hypothetical protein
MALSAILKSISAGNLSLLALFLYILGGKGAYLTPFNPLHHQTTPCLGTPPP